MPAPPIQPKCKFPCGTIVHHGNPWACPPQGLVTELDTKRFFTTTLSCEFEHPETCERYKRVTLYWNCPLVEGEENTPTEKWFQGATEIPKPSEEIIMALTLFPAAQSGPTCESWVSEPLDLTNANAPAGTTFADVIALVVAADGSAQTYPSFGAIDATADTVMTFNVIGEKDSDVILIDGNPQNGVSYAFDAANPSTFPGQTPIEVPAGCEATVTLCLQKCQNKDGTVAGAKSK